MDLVILQEVIEHIPQPPYVVLEKIRTMLAPGGLLFLTTPNGHRFRNVLYMLAGREIVDIYRYPCPGDALGHQHEYTMKQMLWQAREAGFEVRSAIYQDGWRGIEPRSPAGLVAFQTDGSSASFPQQHRDDAEKPFVRDVVRHSEILVEPVQRCAVQYRFVDPGGRSGLEVPGVKFVCIGFGTGSHRGMVGGAVQTGFHGRSIVADQILQRLSNPPPAPARHQIPGRAVICDQTGNSRSHRLDHHARPQFPDGREDEGIAAAHEVGDFGLCLAALEDYPLPCAVNRDHRLQSVGSGPSPTICR